MSDEEKTVKVSLITLKFISTAAKKIMKGVYLITMSVLFSQCGICSKQFVNKGNLKSHVQNIHLKNHANLKCPSCLPSQITYKHERNLVIHMRKTHFGGLDKTKGDQRVKQEIKMLIKNGNVFNYIRNMH